MELIFWLSVAVVVYTYLGYAVILCTISFCMRTFHKKNNDSYNLPCVSVVVAAYNEEENITRRLENLVAQDYPKALYEIIIVSDGSTDCTHEYAAKFVDESSKDNQCVVVRLLIGECRDGKARALNIGVQHACGEIVVFADCRQQFEQTAVKELVGNFVDPSVGCVSGELILKSSEGGEIGESMGAYWHYEKFVRKLEAKSGSVVGATGAIYAVRRNLYRPIPEKTLLDDVLIPIYVVASGHRVGFDDFARAYDCTSKTLADEWRRKVRTLAGNWQLFGLLRPLYASLPIGFLWRLVSHKLLRLLVPYCLIAIFFTGLFLPHPLYRICLVAQLLCYGLALWAKIHSVGRTFPLARFCLFFVTLNLAAIAGLYVLLRGQEKQIWSKKSIGKVD